MNPSATPVPTPLDLAGSSVRLWPDRALDWPAGATLFLADPHFGKTAAFRRLGLAVPDPTSVDLARIDQLLTATGATRLVILGDFFHARSGCSPDVLATLEAWRRRHPALECVLVRGNHDRQAGDPPPGLGITCVEEGWPLGPFRCFHVPPECPPAYSLAGHVHPGWTLRDRNGASLRAPCFAVGPEIAILPAFGSFTGLHPLSRTPETRIFLPTPPRLVEVPESTPRTRSRGPRPRSPQR